MSKRWQETRIGDVLAQVRREEVVDPVRQYRLLGVRWYGGGLFAKEELSGQQIRASKLYRVEQGDFVYNRLFAWKGSFAVATGDAASSYVSNEFPCFVPIRERVEPRFLLWYFRRESAWNEALGLSSGATPTSRNRLKEALFLEMQIPLPPLAEQRRVVARIEELAAQIHEARNVRQQAAEEAEALVRSHLNELFGDFYSSRVGKLKIQHWERIEAISHDVADGPHVTPAYVPDGIPFITVLNITSGRIRFGHHKFITPADHAQFQKRAKAERGDVLISKDGTIGVPCFIDTECEFSFFVSVALIKPNRQIIDGEYLTWVLRVPYVQERIAARSRGDMIRHLVLREIRDLTVPVPSLPEQRRIVAELDALQAEVDALKRLQAETAAELDALLPAILDRAFRGEL